MHSSLRVVAASSALALAALAGWCEPSSAAPRTACGVLPASQASGILGTPVTALPRPSTIKTNSICMYVSGRRPVFQVGLAVMETEAVAVMNLKMKQQDASSHPNVSSRQKGNVVLSGVAMTGDYSKLNALLDAAAKNL